MGSIKHKLLHDALILVTFIAIRSRTFPNGVPSDWAGNSLRNLG